MQPVPDVVAALKYIEKHDITQYNIQSITTAKLAAIVLGGLAGKKAKASAEDFLPFDTRKFKKDNGLTDESLTIFQKLMKERRLDGRLLALMAEDLKNAAMRGAD